MPPMAEEDDPRPSDIVGGATETGGLLAMPWHDTGIWVLLSDCGMIVRLGDFGVPWPGTSMLGDRGKNCLIPESVGDEKPDGEPGLFPVRGTKLAALTL